MERLQIEQRQEVDRFEMPVERGRTADFRSQRQVSAEQFGDYHRFGGELTQSTIIISKRASAPLRLGEMLAAQICVSGCAHGWVLCRDGTATE